MKKIVSLLLILSFMGLIAGCASRYHSQGAGAGAAIGGISGALLDRKNPWRGGVIGGVLGAILGATLADVSVKASQEAAASGRPVEYRTEDGRGVYRAEPVSDYYRPNERTKCRKVQERVWEEGRLVKDQIKEICEGEKIERRY